MTEPQIKAAVDELADRRRSISPYRIGEHWWEHLSTSRSMRALGGDSPWRRYRPSDRWHRTWQAEWDDCSRAVRAWTRQGVIRKAARAIGVSGE